MPMDGEIVRAAITERTAINRTLCPAFYARHEKAPKAVALGALDGAGNRSRTYDLRITNALLYQLSYSGLFGTARSIEN